MLRVSRPSAAPSRTIVVVKCGRSSLANFPHRPRFRPGNLPLGLQLIDGLSGNRENHGVDLPVNSNGDEKISLLDQRVSRSAQVLHCYRPPVR